MNYIFFLILLLPFTITLIPETFAEGELVHRWSSTSLNIPDGIDEQGNILYQSNIMTETDDYVGYESAVYSLRVDKNTCVVNAYDGGYINEKTPGFVLSHKVQESVFPTGVWNDHIIFDSCVVTYSPNQIIVTQNDANVIYDFFDTSFEWTYDYTNNDPVKLNHKYGFVSECNGSKCNATVNERPMGNNEKIPKGVLISNNIQIDSIRFDTKNNIHDFANSIHQVAPGRIIFEFNDAKTRLGVGESLTVDPTFSYTVGTEIAVGAKGQTGSACGDAYSIYDNGNLDASFTRDSTSSSDFSCERGTYTWDISSIPDWATITDVSIRFDVTTTASPRTGDFVEVDGNDPRALQIDNAVVDNTDADLLWDAFDTVYVSGSTDFQTVANDYIQDLGTDADIDLKADLIDDYFVLGTKSNNETRDGINRTTELTDVELQVTYTVPPNPDAVDDLTYTDITDTTVDLAWTQPALNTGNLTGYQIKYDTPWTSSPSIILTNNTLSTDVTSQISGLTQLTNYTFQIGVWTEGYNGTGNILNVTTLEDFPLANYTLGFLDMNVTNTDIIQMFFERQDINSTALFLNVTYPKTYDLACNFDYEFANTNQTYTNLSNVTISATAVESSFQFIDVDNEIIRVYCWDTGNLDNNGDYLITQTNFPLLDQIDNFRNGTYGTQGQIGVLDAVTLMVIVISFIGFNRVNEAVGGIFCIAILGATAYFGIIELPTVIFGGLAIVLMLVITTVRKR